MTCPYCQKITYYGGYQNTADENNWACLNCGVARHELIRSSRKLNNNGGWNYVPNGVLIVKREILI